MLQKIFFSAWLIGCSFCPLAQAVGGYQSFQTGNRDVTAWATPAFAGGAYSILNTHAAAINTRVNINQAAIKSGGTLVPGYGTVSIANRTGDDAFNYFFKKYEIIIKRRKK